MFWCHYGLPDAMSRSVGRQGPTLAVVWYICQVLAALVGGFPEVCVVCLALVTCVPAFLAAGRFAGRLAGRVFLVVRVVAVSFLSRLLQNAVPDSRRPLAEEYGETDRG